MLSETQQLRERIKMMKSWLILETSGRTAHVGLAIDGTIVASAAWEATRRTNRDLVPTAARLVHEAGITKQFSGVMVGIGPGSYTGLRIGMMIAKSLAYALDCELVIVPTFHTIASRVPRESSEVAVVADALQGTVYLQRFGRDREALEPLRIISIKDWENEMPSGIEITGPGVELIPKHLASPAKLELREPIPEAVFQIGMQLQSVTREEMFACEPIYIRGSSAEEKARSTVS